MINGLFIEMSSDKLRKILEEKANYHSDKAATYRQQADNLTETVGESGQSNDPTHSLRESQRTHEGKATFFLLLMENLIPNETYRLSEQDCLRLDLYSRYF